MDRWEPWIAECVNYFLDGDGTFRRFRYGLPYNEQPWIDMQIYNVIRMRFLELRREQIKSGKRNA